MQCEICGEDLHFFRRDLTTDEFGTDAEGRPEVWLEETVFEEQEKWFTCGCSQSPYVVVYGSNGEVGAKFVGVQVAEGATE